MANYNQQYSSKSISFTPYMAIYRQISLIDYEIDQLLRKIPYNLDDRGYAIAQRQDAVRLIYLKYRKVRRLMKDKKYQRFKERIEKMKREALKPPKTKIEGKKVMYEGTLNLDNIFDIDSELWDICQEMGIGLPTRKIENSKEKILRLSGVLKEDIKEEDYDGEEEADVA